MYAYLHNSHNNNCRNHRDRIFYKTIFRLINQSCILWGTFHEFVCMFGDFYASGMQDTEVTKSLSMKFLVEDSVCCFSKRAVPEAFHD